VVLIRELKGTPTSLAVIPGSISALGQLQVLRLHGCHLQVRGFYVCVVSWSVINAAKLVGLGCAGAANMSCGCGCVTWSCCHSI
jgi:hypothetical protein